MKTTFISAVLLVSFALIACGSGADKPAGSGSSSSPTPLGSASGAKYPGTDAGAKALLQEFVKPGADHAALSKTLRPAKADYDAVFTSELAAKADSVYGPAWDAGQLVVAPKEGQTQVLVFSATSDELKSGSGGAAKFPGGWKEVGSELKPGVKFYAFKFVEPGKELGMAFDGLAYVNGNWRIFPKPWRVKG